MRNEPNQQPQFIEMLSLLLASSLALPSPEQIHLSLGTSNDSMVVTFVTTGASSPISSQVQYTAGGHTHDALVTTVPTTVSTYTAGGWVGLIHRAELSGLKAGQRYSYRCGVGGSVWGDWTALDYYFTTTGGKPVSFAVVADLDGREPAGLSTIDALAAAAKGGKLDAVLHAGDVSPAIFEHTCTANSFSPTPVSSLHGFWRSPVGSYDAELAGSHW